MRDILTDRAAQRVKRDAARQARAEQIAAEIFDGGYLSTMDNPEGILAMLTDAALRGLKEGVSA